MVYLNNKKDLVSKQQLIEVFSRGCKPKSEWRIGTEHEKFGFMQPQKATLLSVAPYSAPLYSPNGIKDILQSLESEDFSPILDHHNIIGLNGQNAHAKEAISLEPAGQFELSGAPLETLHQTKEEMDSHLSDVKRKVADLGIGFFLLGAQPLWRVKDMPWMPKSRYVIMRNYMPKVGTRGLDMMTRTCTVQVNLDFASESDMAKKMRVAIAIQPVTTALFANSPFMDGKLTGMMSSRAWIWLDTDNQRSGQPKLFFDKGFSFEKYVDWVLDVPMYFIIRDKTYIDVSGASFRDWMNGKPDPRLKSYKPTIEDFEDHITTAFPDVRLKQFLEMRGADAGSPEMMLAMSSFWVGLLYDDSVLLEVEKIVDKYSWEDWHALSYIVPEKGMLSPFAQHKNLYDLLKILLDLAQEGLKTRKLDEEKFLEPLWDIAAGGKTQAEKWIDKYKTQWKGDICKIFSEAGI